MCKAVHSRQNDPETVEQRNAYAQLVLRSKLHMLTCKEAVVSYIIMCKHHTLRKSCRSGCVLHVHHIMAAHLRLCLHEVVVIDIASQKQDFCSIIHTAIFLLSDVDHILHAREPLALEITSLAGPEFRKHGIDHIHIIVTTSVSIHDTESVHV